MMTQTGDLVQAPKSSGVIDAGCPRFRGIRDLGDIRGCTDSWNVQILKLLDLTALPKGRVLPPRVSNLARPGAPGIAVDSTRPTRIRRDAQENNPHWNFGRVRLAQDPDHNRLAQAYARDFRFQPRD